MTPLLTSRLSGSCVARFLLTGGSATLFNLCLLWLLARQLGIWYVAASVLSYAISVAVNFSLQRAWTFAGTDVPILRQFPNFLGVNLASLVLNTIMLYALVTLARLPLLFSQTLSASALCVLSFFAYRRIFAVGHFGGAPTNQLS